MGFFTKLMGKDDWKKTLIKDLTMLTAVDGDMDPSELEELLNISRTLGFSDEKFTSLMENLGDVKNIYPTDPKDKLDFMTYMLTITYADGYVDDNEVEYMKIVAQRMNLTSEGVDKLIAIIENQ